jgi:signal transduction protein with GAF and PtsI domain
VKAMLLALDTRPLRELLDALLADPDAAGDVRQSARPTLLAFAERHGIPV